LIQLAEQLPRVRNYNVVVDEEKGKVRLLHRIAPGGADKSYGIHVARLAGLPRAVVNRAEDVLGRLEAASPGQERMAEAGRAGQSQQLSLFTADDALRSELAGLDVDSLTPLEAIATLYALRERAKRTNSPG